MRRTLCIGMCTLLLATAVLAGEDQTAARGGFQADESAARPTVATEREAPADPGASTLDWPVGGLQPYALDSGLVANAGRDHVVAYEKTISVEDAVWLRLYFSRVALEPGSFVRVTSIYDGEVQELDADGMAIWNNTSAYFNGDTVVVELLAAPGTNRNQIILDRVAVYIVAEEDRGPCADDDCGICGADSRVPSSEEWSGRIMPVGCTGSVIDTSSCVVSAGHCADGNYDDVIQFNVPDSSSNCSPYNPPVADQFPITGHLYVNGGIGNDWSVMTPGVNSYNEKPYDRYGVYRPIASSLPGSGESCAVWGYGVDNDQPTRSQTQQTHSGSIVTRYSSYYTFNVDITYGNSGSGLIHDGEIIGIVTHCSFDCYNYATRVDVSAFENAREQLCGGGGGYCSAGSSSTSYEHISNVTVGSINNSSGSSGYADYTYLSTDMNTGTGYSITVTIGTPYSSDIGGLWVDWNQDEDFSDAGETITTSWSGSGPYSTTITPPTGAAPGSTRMRVRIQDGNYDPSLSPCGTTSYGEVEDYSINVTQYVDTTPPEPDPMAFASPPAAISASAVTMTATTAVDSESPPVQYQFDFYSGGSGGTDSGWQLSTGYTDYGLQANTTYQYRVRARDSASTPNVTGYSSIESAVTWANVPDAPTLSNPTSSTLDLNVNPGGNPSSTEFAVGCTATSPSDPNWAGAYVNAGGGASGSPVWRTDSQWGTINIIGLQPSTSYTFAVKARNLDAVETGFGLSATLSTTGPSYEPGDLNCDGTINTFDIDPFVLALTDPAEYANQYPACDRMLADIDDSGEVNTFDIDPFVDLLTGK